jgi:hypothetical protein
MRKVKRIKIKEDILHLNKEKFNKKRRKESNYSYN